MSRALLLTLAVSGALMPWVIHPIESVFRRAGDQIGGLTQVFENRPGSKSTKSSGRPPVVFEPNQGQSSPQAGYVARATGITAFFTPTELVLVVRVRDQKQTLRMKLVGSNPSPKIEALEPLRSVSNYLIGSDPSKWRSNVPNYARVAYREVYPGIDLEYYGKDGSLEYDWIVSPGADPSQIKMAFGDPEKLALTPGGDLVIGTEAAKVTQRRPIAYQHHKHRRKHVESRFVLESNVVGFEIGDFDRTLPLTIDPLVYSTFLGGAHVEVGNNMAVDSAGYSYVIGTADESDFPTTPGAAQAYAGSIDAFVTKLNPQGTTLIYSTFLGGGGEDYPFAIAVDGTGNAHIGGVTRSSNFPTTPGAFQTTPQASFPWDGFVTKLNSNGTGLMYSTYLGGDADNGAVGGEDQVHGIAVAANANIFVTGLTRDRFPTTLGAFDRTYGDPTAFEAADAFVTQINPTSSTLVYSTLLGGDGAGLASDIGEDIAIDSSGNAVVGGSTRSSNFPTTEGAFQTSKLGTWDNFLTKVNSTGSGLLMSTLIGGSGNEGEDYALGTEVELDTSDNIYLGGSTDSADFPITQGAFQNSLAGSFDAYVAKFNPSATALVYSTYLGGSGREGDQGSILGVRMAIDSDRNVYVSTTTDSTNFPMASPVFGFKKADLDRFVAKINPQGNGLIWSSYLGGSLRDWAGSVGVDGHQNVFVSGFTRSADFPTTTGVFDQSFGGGFDAFATKFTTAARERFADFNANGATDLALYRAGTGTWYVTQDSFPGPSYPVATSWGGDPTDKAVAADYDGDGHTDPAVYRGGTWYINTKNNGILQYSWGGDSTDIPVPADYDGDGDADIAVYRKGTGTWYVNAQEQGGGPADISIYQWGGDSTDKPAPGDYDGDGDIDVAVYRGGTWYINLLEGGPGDVLQYSWGGDSTDKPVPGDWDGDGDTDVAVYRAGTGYWYMNLNEGGPGDVVVTPWGGDPTDKPEPADWDRDGDTDVAVYRGGTWYINRNEGKPGDITQHSWGGDSTDVPVIQPHALR